MSAFESVLGAQTLQILGWALLHSLWIGALIGVVFGILRPFVRHHISLRYWLGVICLFTFASVEIALFLNALLNSLVFTPLGVTAEASPVLTVLHGTSIAPYALAQPSTLPWTMLLGFLWLLGVGISTWRLLRSHQTLRLLAVNAQTDADTWLQRMCLPLLDLLQLRTNIRFAVSELIDVPCVIGLFRPLVLLPAALLARMPQDQLELVLLHELSHIKNGDLWINSVQILIEVLMFFHPVVHWISADVRETRERRCDRAVLKLRATPIRYAHALVTLEEFRHEFRGLALAATGGELTARVRDILTPQIRGVTMNTRRSMRGTVMLSLASVVMFASVVSSILVRQNLTTPQDPEYQAGVSPNTLQLGTPLKLDAPLKSGAPFMSGLPLTQPQANMGASAPRTIINEAAQAASKPDRLQIATPHINASARKVLRAPRHLLAKPTLTPHTFERIASLKITRTEANDLASAIVPEVLPELLQTPKILARVQPVFAPGERKRQTFTLSFSLNAEGIPRQIVLARGQASQRQLAAARTALAQWRFEPQASAKFVGKRLEQSFAFREVECTPSVGTRICR